MRCSGDYEEYSIIAKMIIRRAISTYCISQFCLCILLSCDLFSTREPELPAGSSSGGRQFPSDPRIVIDNLIDAVERRSSVDYMQTFFAGEEDSTNFEFNPDPESVRSFPGRFDNWNLNQERRFAETLFAPATLPLDSLVTLEIAIDRETVIGDSAETTAQYTLHIGHLRDGAPRQMSGRMELKLFKGSGGGWTVQKWFDTRLAGSSCWSDLKAHF